MLGRIGVMAALLAIAGCASNDGVNGTVGGDHATVGNAASAGAGASGTAGERSGNGRSGGSVSIDPMSRRGPLPGPLTGDSRGPVMADPGGT